MKVALTAEGPQIISGTYRGSGEDQPVSSTEHIRMDFAVGNIAGTQGTQF